MNFPLNITDWNLDDFELALQIIAVFLILVILIYSALSSRKEE